MNTVFQPTAEPAKAASAIEYHLTRHKTIWFIQILPLLEDAASTTTIRSSYIPASLVDDWKSGCMAVEVLLVKAVMEVVAFVVPMSWVAVLY